MIGDLQYRILKDKIKYTGRELKPHWGLEKTGVFGSLATAFTGPCHVQTKDLVDLEDRLAKDYIKAKLMLHFIIELFGTTLEAGVLYQRLFITVAESILRKMGQPKISRSGDDLFLDGKKLSVSIATVSAVSVLIHTGINIDSRGAPINAADLSDFSHSQVLVFAETLLKSYCHEINEIQKAYCKVKPLA